MPDVVGFRAKMGLIVPSTNTVAETDMWSARVPGVTFHTGRLFVSDPDLTSDEAFEAFLEQLRVGLDVTVRDVATCKPDFMVMGMSSETFWGGAEGNARFIANLERLSGCAVATGASACQQALEVLSCSRLGIVTPYQPVGDEQVRRYFADIGCDVVRLKGLRCPNATAPASVDERALREALVEVDGPDVDALLQVGTNLSMVRLADEAETAFGKPVIAINAAILWSALRAYGIEDRFRGYGPLLREH